MVVGALQLIAIPLQAGSARAIGQRSAGGDEGEAAAVRWFLRLLCDRLDWWLIGQGY
jgi:hypothetical protein